MSRGAPGASGYGGLPILWVDKSAIAPLRKREVNRHRTSNAVEVQPRPAAQHPPVTAAYNFLQTTPPPRFQSQLILCPPKSPASATTLPFRSYHRFASTGDPEPGTAPERGFYLVFHLFIICLVI